MNNYQKYPTYMYHGTSSDNLESLKQGIDVSNRRNGNFPDFGPGFYVTSYERQASIWAMRKANQYNRMAQRQGLEEAHAVVIQYKVDLKKLSKLRQVHFASDTIDWFNYIKQHRLMNSEQMKQWSPQNDIVFGPMADGDPSIQTYLLDYREGIINEQELYESIRPPKNKVGDQLSIHTPDAAYCFKISDIRKVGR